MIGLLARRTLGDRPKRTAMLLLGLGIAVGVMITLLSIGDAILEQSRQQAQIRSPVRQGVQNLRLRVHAQGVHLGEEDTKPRHGAELGRGQVQCAEANPSDGSVDGRRSLGQVAEDVAEVRAASVLEECAR